MGNKGSTPNDKQPAKGNDAPAENKGSLDELDYAEDEKPQVTPQETAKKPVEETTKPAEQKKPSEQKPTQQDKPANQQQPTQEKATQQPQAAEATKVTQQQQKPTQQDKPTQQQAEPKKPSQQSEPTQQANTAPVQTEQRSRVVPPPEPTAEQTTAVPQKRKGLPHAQVDTKPPKRQEKEQVPLPKPAMTFSAATDNDVPPKKPQPRKPRNKPAKAAASAVATQSDQESALDTVPSSMAEWYSQCLSVASSFPPDALSHVTAFVARHAEQPSSQPKRRPPSSPSPHHPAKRSRKADDDDEWLVPNIAPAALNWCGACVNSPIVPPEALDHVLAFTSRFVTDAYHAGEPTSCISQPNFDGDDSNNPAAEAAWSWCDQVLQCDNLPVDVVADALAFACRESLSPA